MLKVSLLFILSERMSIPNLRIIPEIYYHTFCSAALALQLFLVFHQLHWPIKGLCYSQVF